MKHPDKIHKTTFPAQNIRANAKYKDDKQSHSVTADIRIKKDEIICTLSQEVYRNKELSNEFLKNPELIEKQLIDCKKTLEEIKSKTSSTDEASSILVQNLVS